MGIAENYTRRFPCDTYFPSLFCIKGIVTFLLLVLHFAAPFFPAKVEKAVKGWANGSIRGKLNFSKARHSFFTHFPSLTLTLYH
jgi:AsmA protein